MRNLFLALAEALITLLITQIPLILAVIIHALGTENSGLVSSFYVITGRFSPGDILAYSAGILASTTAYAIMKIGDFKVQPTLMILLILLPIVAIMAAIPVFIQDSNDAIKNTRLAGDYVAFVIIVSMGLWIHALYQSRAFFEVNGPSSATSDRIVREIEG